MSEFWSCIGGCRMRKLATATRGSSLHDADLYILSPYFIFWFKISSLELDLFSTFLELSRQTFTCGDDGSRRLLPGITLVLEFCIHFRLLCPSFVPIYDSVYSQQSTYWSWDGWTSPQFYRAFLGERRGIPDRFETSIQLLVRNVSSKFSGLTKRSVRDLVIFDPPAQTWIVNAHRIVEPRPL